MTSVSPQSTRAPVTVGSCIGLVRGSRYIIAHAGHKSDPPASATGVLGLQACRDSYHEMKLQHVHLFCFPMLQHSQEDAGQKGQPQNQNPQNPLCNNGLAWGILLQQNVTNPELAVDKELNLSHTY